MMTNPYEGITFHPFNEKYSATIAHGRQIEAIGIYDSLQEAIDARHAALSTQGQK